MGSSTYITEVFVNKSVCVLIKFEVLVWLAKTARDHDFYCLDIHTNV